MARNRFLGGVWAFGLIVAFGSTEGRAADPPGGAKDGEPCWHGGDINDDGMVSAGDAQLAFLIALGSMRPTPEEFCWADCNGDGTVSAGDAQRIFYAAIGLDECPSNLANGQLCTSFTQCRYDHCQNGHCCTAGDCCFAAVDCPPEYAPPPSCLDVATCQGERIDAVCETFMCGSVVSDDDSGCGPEIEANTCGYYVSVYCSGEVEQNIACPTSCESDAECDPDAHCEGGICIADWPDGGACDADGDCVSDHCTHGICCATGDCCTDAAECNGLGYFREPSCDTVSTCQGTREDAVCTAGFVCTTAVVDDDSACGSDVEADLCGFYVSVYCTGEVEQTVTCPSTCTADGACDPEAHCEGGICIADWPDGGACDADGDCLSAHCAHGTCCAAGDCCTTAALCAELGYVRAPSCDAPATCQGTREDAVCTSGFTCTTTEVADDSACGTAIEANPCGLYVSVYCTGEAEQTVTCPSTCTADGECDPEAHCEGGACIADWPDGGACDAAGDCVSGYCGNGHCCAAGDCCAEAADCAGLGYDSAPVCNTPATCQGTREDAVCSGQFACATLVVDDDSACGGDIEADTCGLYVSVYCTGATEQSVNCPGRCVDDSVCDDEAHCEGGACIADWPDGGACDADGDCLSAHCAHGTCCAAGDCCTTAALCTELGYVRAASCDTPATCQGTREDAVCTSGFTCTTTEVADDSACDGTIEADPCGLYVSVYCTGEPEQSVSCASSCADDADCDPEAHCEGGACIADWPDGGDCDAAGDCQSGYCGNGHCCAAGDCCAEAADCTGLGYDSAPVCNTPATCQGTREDAVCSGQFACATLVVDDDSGCGTAIEADACGYYLSVYCTGEPEQSVSCASSCAGDADCDPEAHCEGGACIADWPDGGDCDAAGDCQSGYCGNGHCCAAGDCCAEAADCTGLGYDSEPVCNTPATCQGTREDAVCSGQFACATLVVDDDSACGTAIEADACGYYLSVYCTGEPEQSVICASSCAGDADCDPEAHCEGGACIADWPDGGDCDAAGDCQSGYCGNGHCCAAGDCCAEAADCAGLGYDSEPVCNSPATCQGTREDAVCSGQFACATLVVDDDSACGTAIEADACGYYLSVYCTGEPEQSVSCASSCAGDADCDPEAHCEGGACVADWPDGGDCDSDGDCVSGYCGNGHCCATGDCCAEAADCTGLGYDSEPVCNSPETCQGTRVDAVCAGDFTCSSLTVDDDSACEAGLEASDCGLFPAVHCGGGAEQTPPECATTCSEDGECDPGVGCVAGVCNYLASCRVILARGASTGDGRYTIAPPGSAPFDVHCDMTTDGGGWTRLAHVSAVNLNLTSATYEDGFGAAGDANYVHACGLFENLDLTNAVMRMNMGAVRDYFKPHSGADVCQMVSESPGVHHLWAATYDGAYVRPSYYSGHLGGSATNWPLTIDGRAYLSFWGYNGSTASGCCHARSANYNPPVDVANWGQPFDMYFREADYPSCGAILRAGGSTGDGVYTIHPPGEPAFPVWCDMTTEGGGFVDLVATLHLPGINLAEYRDRFFLSNNAFSITLGLGNETSSQAPGFYLINNTTTFTHTEGYHFLSPVPYSQVRLTYRMQGDDEGYRCASPNWIPLNGPGYNGGYTGYQSPCPSGYSCIQGTTTDGMDTPIYVSYSSNSINSANTLLTWSGSGVGSAQTGNCARDPQIPIANPTTFFTRFLIREPVNFPSCQAILAAGASQGSGIYTLDPDGGTPFDVYCDMTTASGGWTLVAKFSNQDARHWVTAKSDWTSGTAYGAAADLSTGADAKSAAWGRLAGSEILFTDHVNPGGYIATNNNCLGGVTPAAFFTAALATFPTVQNSYYKVCTVSRTYFPGWAAEPGWGQPVGSPDLSLSTDHFVVAQVDTAIDTSGVLSFYRRDWFTEADVGLGALENGPTFEDSPYQQDVGGPTSCAYDDAVCRAQYPETVFLWIR